MEKWVSISFAALKDLDRSGVGDDCSDVVRHGCCGIRRNTTPPTLCYIVRTSVAMDSNLAWPSIPVKDPVSRYKPHLCNNE